MNTLDQRQAELAFQLAQKDEKIAELTAHLEYLDDRLRALQKIADQKARLAEQEQILAELSAEVERQAADPRSAANRHAREQLRAIGIDPEDS